MRQQTRSSKEPAEKVVQARHLRGQHFSRLLSVGRIELAQISCHALLQLGTSPFYLRPCEVLVPVVHGLELAPIEGDARRCKKAHLTAEFDEARTYLAKRRAIVFSEVGDRIVIRREPTQRPHDLDFASGFSFEFAGSTAPGSDSHRCKASGELRNGTTADQLPPAQLSFGMQFWL